MKIRHIYLETDRLSELKAFYRSLFPVIEEGKTHFTLLAGDTAMTFTLAGGHAFYHFAFGLTEEKYRRTVQLLDESISRLQGKNGEEEFMSGQWKRKQVYYRDPAGNLIEVMRHPGRPGLLEIGLPVRNVPDFIEEVTKHIPTSYSAESEMFAFLGDGNGVLVVTKEGRPWFPAGIPSEIHSIILKIETGIEEQIGRLSFPGLPYTILLT
ncbi:VOC family protein [Planococcus lenghuensis]|uniref:VOC domain-containing protein n=1 Tax=Planococcus lenghuensis TaxID=2213202 RepID=A0A1Q2L412_9BACL|nr:hypothetical protein [Planococcus lenghuensis]AQQ54797.1 hypothetical protein B0X71_17940 [Planococcus lenghuensis]